MAKMCRHCKQKTCNRPRGLCWTCFYNAEVRKLYECYSSDKYARRGILDKNGHTSAPGEPTDALPGSAEKIAVLAERAARGLSLWHPLDSRDDDKPVQAEQDIESDCLSDVEKLADLLELPRKKTEGSAHWKYRWKLKG